MAEADAEARRLRVEVEDAERSKTIGLDFWAGETRRREQAEAELKLAMRFADAGLVKERIREKQVEVLVEALQTIAGGVVAGYVTGREIVADVESLRKVARRALIDSGFAAAQERVAQSVPVDDVRAVVGELQDLREAVVVHRKKLGKAGWFCLICRMWWPVNTHPIHAYEDGDLLNCPLSDAALNRPAIKKLMEEHVHTSACIDNINWPDCLEVTDV